METYTPTPTQLTDVSLPQAGIDQVGVSTVRVGMEAEADGIAWANKMLFLGSPLAHRDLTFEIATFEESDYLNFSLVSGSNTGVAGDQYGAAVSLTLISDGDGECLKLGGSAGGGVRGVWRISGYTVVRNSSSIDPIPAQLSLYSSTTAAFAAATLVQPWKWYRYSTDPNDDIPTPFSFEFFHDSIDDIYLAVRVAPGATGDHDVRIAGRLSVTQLSRVLP